MDCILLGNEYQRGFYSFCVIEIPGGEAFVVVTTFELLFYCSIIGIHYDVRSPVRVCQ